MKTNLDEFFKTNSDFEKEGVWYDFGSVRFLIRRFGGKNGDKLRLALAKYHKPVARQVELGTLPETEERLLYAKAFVDACLVDWKGVEIDGEEAPFSGEAAIKLLVGLPDLLAELLKLSQDIDNYKDEVGNSLGAG